LREALGLDQLLRKLRTGWNYTRYDLAPYAAQARAIAPAIKVALHLTITSTMSDVQIVHQLLAQMGIKIQQLRWSRSVEGHEGEKLRVYGLDIHHWRTLWQVLERRHLRRQQLLQEQQENSVETGSPTGFEFKHLVGDPAQELAEVPLDWFTPEAISDTKAIWKTLQDTMTVNHPVSPAQLGIPEPFLRYIGLVA
ncbi:MAG TPA: hypothetical protein V6C88_15245, partial [Chroococcidiopsis sp.]